MSDIFQEVDEDLRRDRVTRTMKRYGALFIALAVLLVAGTGGYTAWRNWRLTQRQAETATLVTEMAAAGAAGAAGAGTAADALAAYAAKAPPDMGALARFGEAALRAGAGKPGDSVAVYDALAANPAVDPMYRDLATLMSVMRQFDTAQPAALEARLKPLTADTSPWRFSARELTGLAAVRAGDVERARTLFQQLADDASAPAGLRSRAVDLAALYGRT